MFGTTKDQHSNPMKISINPQRSGDAAIADEWFAVKLGTDGASQLAKIAAGHSGRQRWIWNSMANALS